VKKTACTIKLHRETLRQLEPSALSQIAAGEVSRGVTICNLNSGCYPTCALSCNCTA
jgi:hypothetical protein